MEQFPPKGFFPLDCEDKSYEMKATLYYLNSKLIFETNVSLVMVFEWSRSDFYFLVWNTASSLLFQKPLGF